MPDDPPPLSLHGLRRRWKPHKLRLAVANPEHPTNIRFHRACSWLQRAEALDDPDAPDAALLLRWVAFNALYGQWDHDRHETRPDKTAWIDCLCAVLRLDTDGTLGDWLTTRRDWVMELLDDQALRRQFWHDPDPHMLEATTRARHEAKTWYLQQDWVPLLKAVLLRVYFLRCQIVHGAATHGSELNRNGVHLAGAVLAELVPRVLDVWVERGADTDWGPLCYPPVSDGA